MEASGTYPNRILWYIKDRGRKVSEVAEYLQISEATLAHYAHGRISVSNHYREKLAQFLRCTVDELFPLRTHPSHQAKSETPSTQSYASDTVQEVDSVQGELHMNNGRRNALQQLVAVSIPAPLWERLLNALDKPSSIDEPTLTMLEAQVQECWQLQPRVLNVVSYNLLQYVEGRLAITTSLLEGSLLPRQRVRLSHMAGELALILGVMYLNLHMYEQAKRYLQASIEAAKEANNAPLQAVSLGRLSFALVYNDQTNTAKANLALSLLQEAQRLTAQDDMRVLRSWLAAREAEVQANLHHEHESLAALERARVVRSDVGLGMEKGTHPEDPYWTNYDQLLAQGYQGVCRLHLGQLQDAETILTEAANLQSPTRMYHQPIILVDLASVCHQQGDLAKACDYARQALLMTHQTLSPMHLERVLTFRQEIDAWSPEQAVRDLDRQIVLAQSQIRGTAA
jgi:tetratricopeptide (TPR) repeat protein